MIQLLSFFGGCEPYATGAKKLSETLGFSISATAVQNNTEMVGNLLESEPAKIMPLQKQTEEADHLVVEIYETMSPQITEKEGIIGRVSFKQPTEYEECNIISIEKYRK